MEKMIDCEFFIRNDLTFSDSFSGPRNGFQSNCERKKKVKAISPDVGLSALKVSGFQPSVVEQWLL